jgi:peptidoglycan/xylan/chitin deacetylase (PgdA/CDA1 family)
MRLFSCVILLVAALQPQPPARVVAITIDDLPVSGASPSADWGALTHQLLAALRRHGVTAVGFVNETKLYRSGELDSGRVALLQEWLDAGQELGNHTFAHRSAHATPLDDYLAGIARGEIVTRALARRANRPFRYFRHPQLHAGRTLAYRHAVEVFLRGHGYTIAPVTVDNQEWVYAGAYWVVQERGDTTLRRRIVADYLRHLDSAFTYSERVSRQLFGREIPFVLLLHANQINADYLDTVLTRLKARGYRFETLEQVLADSAYRSADTYVGATGPSWLVRWAETRGVAVGPEPREDAYVSEILRNR